MLPYDNLEEYANPEIYDAEYGDDRGLSFYLAIAEETGGPALDLACGTGRLTIPLARRGLAAVGIDLSQPMIEQARAKSAGLPVRWVCADVCDFDLGETFALITMTGNAFQAMLTRAEQIALLGRARAHLRPGGIFAFETRNPQPDDLRTGEGEEQWHRFVNAQGELVQVTGTQRYDPGAQLVHYTTIRRWRSGGEPRENITRLTIRFTGADELDALLAEAGLTVEQRYGDWDRSPLTPASPRILTLAR